MVPSPAVAKINFSEQHLAFPPPRNIASGLDKFDFKKFIIDYCALSTVKVLMLNVYCLGHGEKEANKNDATTM